MSERTARVERATRETKVAAGIDLDGNGTADVATGLRCLDHMFETLARHARMDIRLSCTGDLDVDDHHSAEDCALALGGALAQALGDKRGIRRFGEGHAPLDEALARAVVDLSGRPFAHIDLGLRRERIGDTAAETVVHVLHSFAMAARLTLHIDLLRGDNDHHRAEAAFKALALALRMAVAAAGHDDIPSAKGTL